MDDPISQPGLNLYRVLSENGLAIRSFDWSPDGQSLVSGGEDAKIRVWNLCCNTVEKTISTNSHSIIDIAWSPDGEFLAIGSRLNSIFLYDLHFEPTLIDHNDTQSQDWFSSALKLLGLYSRPIKQTEKTSKQFNALKGHEGWVSSVAWSSDGLKLV